MEPNPQLPPSSTSPPPAAGPFAASETNVRVIYVLYLASLLVGVTAIVGVVMAYLNQGSAPEGLQTHYRFLIRTFWIGILYAAVGLVLSMVFIGFAVLCFALVWLIVRCVKGLKLLGERQPIPDPATWLW